MVCTPPELICPIEDRFGKIRYDLAATTDNTVATYHLGPGSGVSENALDVPWTDTMGLCWCNPPFSDIFPWVGAAAHASTEFSARILMLVPCSRGSNWWHEYVEPFAFAFHLSPRVTFVGHTAPYPKDLSLLYYGPEGFTGEKTWKWKGGK